MRVTGILTVNIDVIIRRVALPRAVGGMVGVGHNGLVYGAWREVDVTLDEFPFVGFGDDFAVEGGGCVRHDCYFLIWVLYLREDGLMFCDSGLRAEFIFSGP